MQIDPFLLERYFAEYEFKVRHLLSPSDCESLSLQELLGMADPQVRQLWDELRLGYTESTGHPLLRAEIGRTYSATPTENILVAVPEEAIYIVMNTLLKKGDQVIILTPAYQSLYQIALSLGCQVRPWRIERFNGAWHLDLDWLVSNLNDNTRLLVINLPHNPTGLLPDRAEFQAIIDLVSRHGVYLFCDEMYRGLEYAPAQRLPAACDAYERGVSLSGLSKTYALPGLRVGWLASQDVSLTQSFLALKDYLTICNSAPSELLGLIALRAQEAIIERNLGIIQKNVAAAAQFFHQHPALFEWLPPRAGSIAFPRWTGPGTVDAFCQSALDQLGVMIAPGKMFEMEVAGERQSEHLRVGLGRLGFEDALAQLQDHPLLK